MSLQAHSTLMASRRAWLAPAAETAPHASPVQPPRVGHCGMGKAMTTRTYNEPTRRETGHVPPTPPRIPGLPSPRVRDLVRYVGWNIRGAWHQARHATSVGEAVAMSALAAFELVFCWAHLASIAILTVVHHRTRRTYLTPERDAWITVQATRDEWRVVDHVAQHIGTGAGRRLRLAVARTLLPYADENGIAITAVAISRRTAQLYLDDLPGLRIVRRRGFWYHLRRDPNWVSIRRSWSPTPC